MGKPSATGQPTCVRACVCDQNHSLLTLYAPVNIDVGERLCQVLTKASIPCSYSYSALDPTARKINVAKFRNKMTRVLVVTDLAARGIDIPMLDVVVNFNFPAKPKLFIHRVGQYRSMMSALVLQH